jgi:CxxC-x17-CxxC domain-containing protein
MQPLLDLYLLVDEYAAALPDLDLHGDGQEEYSAMLLWLQNQLEAGLRNRPLLTSASIGLTALLPNCLYRFINPLLSLLNKLSIGTFYNARDVSQNGRDPGNRGSGRNQFGPVSNVQCTTCGRQTTVPFKPTQGRPVLCRTCFDIASKAAIA